ncbi:MAG: cell division protein FtsZ, partial [Candidatus Thermoplasmatota archaeon]|nr:cell division protein FtsZ [Candidatus Thermoplasmatota archaeon]
MESSIISEAMKYSNVQDRTPDKGTGSSLDLGKLMASSPASTGDEWFGLPQIMIVGCGGAGCNTVNRVKKMGVKGSATIALNTDKVHLDMIQADKKMLIGRDITRGLGAGGYPEVGQQAAERSRSEIEEMMRGADLVFITCGMGGGTGTGSAPVVADIAKKLGAIVIGMVSSPFNVERARLG